VGSISPCFWWCFDRGKEQPIWANLTPVQLVPLSMITKIIVCFILVGAALPFSERAAAASSATLVLSAPSAIVEAKTRRQYCWQRCRHLCRGRPKTACGLCMRQCKAQSAKSLVGGNVFRTARDDAPQETAIIPELASPATQLHNCKAGGFRAASQCNRP
jgi:hypothetical protein